MDTYTHTGAEEKSNAAGNRKPASQNTSQASPSFVDNRPEAVAQRRLQAMVDNSPRMVIQRAAVTATDLGNGSLRVDTGGDFDNDHLADSWSTAVAKSGKRNAIGVTTNTIFTDPTDVKSKVGGAEYSKSIEVSGIDLWQIDTKQAKEGTIGEEPPKVSKSVVFKSGIAKDDGNLKKRGAYTRDKKGTVLLVTGVRSVK